MSRATLRRISGPVLHGRTTDGFMLHEAVRVGDQDLVGEVVQLHADEIVVQVYEDTTGLKPGSPIRGTGAPLSVPLGPGMLGRIFDGLLRPLAADSPFIDASTPRKGPGLLPFRPRVAVGDLLGRGGVLGVVEGAARTEPCLAPPDVEGEVIWVAEAGERSVTEPLCAVRDAAGRRHDLSMTHPWPVRRPRPSMERLPADRPLLTGQRIIDTLFPLARGGRAALPGGFGTGKTILQQTLARWSDADVVVYVGCGERGNEMAEVLTEFPQLQDPRSGRPLMERTVVIANTSNMPVAAREASIYAGVTVGEYFRDQGLHVALMADSTSRWAEALREVSGRLGELPAEGGYPAYLSSRLAEFYERAGRVRTLGGQEGSLTLIGAISPPGGDFSEPVTKHTQRYIRSMWTLDPARAHARSYPAIHPLTSYSEDVEALFPWWEQQGNARWREQRRRLLTLLGEHARLERMARIVGKDALPPAQRLVLLCADLVNEAFLRQSALSPVDAYCSPTRQAEMLRLLLGFVDLAEAALEQGVAVERIAALPVLARLRRMGEEIGEGQPDAHRELAHQVEAEIAGLPRGGSDAA